MTASGGGARARVFGFGWLQRLLKRPPVVTRAILAGEQYRTRVAKSRRRSLASSARASCLRESA
jgi:hypothetical protein